MRLTKLFTKTSKNVPADETAKNAKLLIQAGFIHKEMAGVYSYLPLGLRVLRNIETIVRKEMDAIGGQEVSMPALQVKERYELTNRWDDEVVDNWFKTKLVNGTEVGLGFSHEENLAPIVKQYATSYRELPFIPYQIQTKFRNELRSKSGLMRGREFVMKDMYSFAIDQAQHEDIYEQIAGAYHRVYDHLGIGESTVRVKASGGSFSKYSDEYQTFSEAGEDIIFQTSDGTFYNREVAPSRVSVANNTEDFKPREDVEAKGVIGVQALTEFFHIPVEKSTKTLIFTANTGEHIFVALRSDYEVNPIKVSEAARVDSIALASPTDVLALTGAEIGYAGLVDTPKDVRVFVDDSLDGLCNFETGSNKTHFHSVNVNFGRDVSQPEQFYDLKIAQQGDLDPVSGTVMATRKSIEVGNIFSLGTKFTKAFNYQVTLESSEQVVPIMGCYGIGVSRLVGTIAELMSDDKGLVWPEAIAPAIVYLAPLGQEEAVTQAADALYDLLTTKNVLVLYDDRDIRAGEKFADADLMGIPFRVVVSLKTLEAGKIEVKSRRSQDSSLITTDELLQHIQTGDLAHVISQSAEQLKDTTQTT